MAIPAETIDKIRLGTDIVELVREYVPAIKKSGRNWKTNCPFHNEKTASFMISPEKGIFHCFGCQAGGDVFKFVMMMDNLSWPEAVKKLGGRLGIVIRETGEDLVKKSEKQKLYDILEQAAHFYNRCLKDTKEGSTAYSYLKKRGVNEDSIKKFLLGYAPKDSLIRSAEKKGISKEQLAAAGLVTKTSRGTYFEYMSGRVVFPIMDTQGRVVAFGGRALKNEEPKYLNTPETAVYSKSKELYGFFQSIPSLRKSSEVIVLEGYMDVVVSHQFGIDNSVATLGTSLTTQHAQTIKRYCDSVVLLFDSDKAGEDAAKRAVDTLIDSEISIKVLSLPEGVDPDEYLIKEGREKFLEFLSSQKKEFIEFLVSKAIEKHGSGSVESRVKAVAEILPLIAKVKNSVLRSELIRFIAEKIRVREEAVISELRRLTKKVPGHGTAKPDEKISKNNTRVRSAEEELLQILLAHPECTKSLDESILKDKRVLAVLEYLKNNVSIPEIVDQLNDPDKVWFRELLIEEKEYSVPEQMMQDIVKGIKVRELEERRRELEEEIILMRSGEKPYDDSKFEKYKELTTQLKGSGK